MCALSLAFIASGCGKGGGPPGGGGPMGGFSLPVSAAPIRHGDITTYFTITGTVTPLLSASLSSTVSGKVLSVSHHIGEHVHQGELLVKIDDSTLRAQQAQAAAMLAQTRATNVGGASTAQANLASARIAYNIAHANLLRNQSLFAQGYVSRTALDQIRDQASSAQAAYTAAQATAQNANMSGGADSAAAAGIQAAQASLGAVSAQIALTDVTAPFDGVVTARDIDPGSLASPGTVLMQVAQLDPVYVDAGIAGNDAPYVHVGTPASVTVSGIDGRTWHGTVAYLNLAALPGTLTYLARIRIANPDLALHGGAIASVAFPLAHKSGVLLAPRAAVFQTPAGYSVFIIDAGKAKEVPVDIGASNDQETEVSGAGLKAGIQAILNHPATLQPGTPVQVIPANGPPGH